jgi:hypothetical protein
MVGLDHIVLFFTEKAMLRRKKAGQLTGKSLMQEIAAMDKSTVDGGLIREKPQPFAGKGIRRRSA